MRGEGGGTNKRSGCVEARVGLGRIGGRWGHEQGQGSEQSLHLLVVHSGVAAVVAAVGNEKHNGLGIGPVIERAVGR